MRSLLLGLLLLFSCALSTAQEERIYSFRSEVSIDTSGTISVQEDIRVYAKGDIFKRGITRALPLLRSEKNGNRIRMNYDVTGVQKDGLPVNFFTEKQGDDLVIYVGDRDIFLDPGFYIYRISYETAGQIGFFDDYDELSWNVNGLSDRPIDTVSAVIRLPAGAGVISSRCYTGGYGSSEGNCTTDTLADGSLYMESVNLQPNEMLTAAVGFTKGIVRQPKVEVEKPRELTFFDKNGLPIVSAIALLLLLIYYFFTWKKYGVDPPKPTVIPLFSPPAGISPASAGLLSKEHYVNDLVTSSIVNLAVKGYLRIKETEKKGIFGIRRDRIYTLIKQKEADASLPNEESIVLRDLFNDGDEVVLDGEYNASVENMMTAYRYDIKNQYASVLKEGRNWKFLAVPLLIMAVYFGFLIYFVSFEPAEQIISFFGSVFFSFFVVTIIAFLLRKIFKKSKVKWFSYTIGAALVVGALSLLYFFPLRQLSVNAIGFIAGFPLIVIGYLLYAYLIKRPGERKLHYQSQIEGLKMYMNAAEEKQLQYFNPPEVTPAVFEALLPYAIALDMEDIWGEKFQSSLLSSSSPGTPPYYPPWFAGTVLSPADFGHTLNSTLSNTVNHAATPPQTSNSGGGNWGSGSFGGGFSGMGGGGGSVGGW